MIRLVLVDDQAGVRRGLQLRLALEPDLAVIGEASDGTEALEVVEAGRPDVVVMDIGMPVMDGFAAAEALKRLTPHCAIIILSIREDVATCMRARAAGVDFVSKHAPIETLIDAIRGSTVQQAHMS